jgi:hypothetical protein
MMEPSLRSAPKIDDHVRSGTPTLAFKSNLAGPCVRARFTEMESRPFDTRVRAGVSMACEIRMLASSNEKRNVPMMTSSQSRPSATPANDPLETLYYAIGNSLLGSVLVASSGNGVASILIGDDQASLIKELKGNFPDAALRVADMIALSIASSA